MIKNKDLKRRIIEISYKNSLSHLGSCLTMVDIIDGVYRKKNPNDICILSAGHAGLALYVVLEKYLKINAETLFAKYGVHPERDEENGIVCTTGSLGHGVGIAIGMATQNKNKMVHCFTTDGEIAEGSVYEALNFLEYNWVNNFKLHINWNGYGAYRKTNFPTFINQAVKIYSTDNELKFLKGLDAHYHIMTEDEYLLAMEKLK